MQLIPATAKRFHVKNAFDAEDNIKGGMAYLQWLLTFSRAMCLWLLRHTMQENELLKDTTESHLIPRQRTM